MTYTVANTSSLVIVDLAYKFIFVLIQYLMNYNSISYGFGISNRFLDLHTRNYGNLWEIKIFVIYLSDTYMHKTDQPKEK